MPRTTAHPKDSNFNFRVDPDLKAAFTRAAWAEDRPAAQILRDFMRAYVRRRERHVQDSEVRDQAQAAGAAAKDPSSDEHAVLRELEVQLDEDHFADEWRA